MAFVLASFAIAQDCTAFLNHGLYNLETRTSQDALDQHLYNELCSENFSTSDWSTERTRSYGGSLGFKGFSLGGDVENGDVKQRFEESREQFCKINEEKTIRNTGFTTEIRTLFPQALDVYERCLELQSRGLNIDMQITPSPKEAQTVTYGLNTSRGGDLKLTGVHIIPADAFTCEGQIDDENNIAFNTGTSTALSNNQVSFTCERNNKDGVYEGATIAIHTNDTNLATYFQRVPTLPQIQDSRAQELEIQTKRLEKQIVDLSFLVGNQIQSIQSDVGGLTNDLVATNETVSQNISSCRVCFQNTERRSQCGGTQSSCSDWATIGSEGGWTSPFRDDTDDRSGGCTYQWKLECK